MGLTILVQSAQRHPSRPSSSRCFGATLIAAHHCRTDRIIRAKSPAREQSEPNALRTYIKKQPANPLNELPRSLNLLTRTSNTFVRHRLEADPQSRGPIIFGFSLIKSPKTAINGFLGDVMVVRRLTTA